MNYLKLASDNPDDAYDLIDAWRAELNSGDMRNSENLNQLLEGFYQADDFDAVVSFCDEFF